MHRVPVREVLFGASAASLLVAVILVAVDRTTPTSEPRDTAGAVENASPSAADRDAASAPVTPQSPRPSAMLSNDDSAFVPVSTSDEPPVTLLPPSGAAPDIVLVDAVNLPPTTPQPPADAHVVSAAVTGSFRADGTVSLTWNYDAVVPGPNRNEGLAGLVDLSRWRLLQSEQVEVQVGIDRLSGIEYRYEPLQGANGTLTYRVLDRKDESHLLQIVHRDLRWTGALDPAAITPTLGWTTPLLAAVDGSTTSLAVQVDRERIDDPWSGTLAVSMRVRSTAAESVRDAALAAQPKGFTRGVLAGSLVAYRDLAGNTITAEVYQDGADTAVEWYARTG